MISAAPAPRARRRLPIGAVVSVAAMVIISVIWFLPLAWTLVVATRPAADTLTSGNIWFGSSLTLQNFGEAWNVSKTPFGLYYLNTVIIAGGVVLVQLVTITLAGYALARLRFPGRDVIFVVILLQILIPSTVLLVPNFSTIRSLGLFDTRWAMMLPYFGSSFGTFLMRQTFKAVPGDLEDAARIDGANWLQILWNVFIPASTAALVAFALVSVSFHWNEFLWPLVVTNSDTTRPLTVGLALLVNLKESGVAPALVTAGTLLVIIPLILLFLIFQRQFVNSFLRSGLK